MTVVSSIIKKLVILFDAVKDNSGFKTKSFLFQCPMQVRCRFIYSNTIKITLGILKKISIGNSIVWHDLVTFIIGFVRDASLIQNTFDMRFWCKWGKSVLYQKNINDKTLFGTFWITAKQEEIEHEKIDDQNKCSCLASNKILKKKTTHALFKI